MTTSQWHVDAELWRRYAAGGLDHVTQSAIDAHVTSCDSCRSSARGQVEPAELERVWSAVSTGISQPPVSRPVRWLRRAGVPDADTVLVAASDGLYLPWVVGVGAAIACAIVTGLVPSHQDVSFLLIAPLIPVLAVIAAYDAMDPLRELVTGTPFSKLRLALLRTVVGLSAALPVTLAVGLLVPGLEKLAFVWLVPGLALTVAALVLLTWLTAWATGTVVSTAWIAVVVALSSQDQLGALNALAAQSMCAVAAVVLAAVLVLRTNTTVRLHGDSS